MPKKCDHVSLIHTCVFVWVQSLSHQKLITAFSWLLIGYLYVSVQKNVRHVEERNLFQCIVFTTRSKWHASSIVSFFPKYLFWVTDLFASSYMYFVMYEVRSETKLAFRVIESLFRLFRFVSSCTEFVSSTYQIISSWIGPIRLVADEFVLSTSQIVSSPTSSSRRLPRSSRHDQTCCHRVRLVDSWDRLITHHSSSTRQVQSSSRRTMGSTRRELIDRDWDRIVRKHMEDGGVAGNVRNEMKLTCQN